MRIYQTFWIIPIFIFLFSSCAHLKKYSIFSAEEEVDTMVTKEKYDALAKKYERLLEEKKLEGLTNDENQILRNSQTREENMLLNDLKGVSNNSAGSVETVDVFANMPKAEIISTANVSSASTTVSAGVLGKQAEDLHKARRLLRENRLSESMGIVNRLEKSESRQIQARAKFVSAEILFNQGEYDLAMQMFEEILNKYAFSGIVIKTLGKLVACSEKLRLKAKQEQYYSLMQTFFDT